MMRRRRVRHGLRFDPSKALLDPYRRAVAVPQRIFSPDGKPIWGERCDGDEECGGRSQRLRLGGRYANYCGTGNTLNANNAIVRRLILDSLRYWVAEMHVDGFGFDLASILDRDETGRPLETPPVLWDIQTDPVLAGTKLIAEAWDVGRSLSGRQLHRRQLEGMERPIPRRRAPFCEGRQRHGAD